MEPKISKDLSQKLSQIISKLKAPKNQRNKFGSYNYRSCEDILEAVKPLLVENNLTLTISDEIIVLGSGASSKTGGDEVFGERFYVKATAKLTDGEHTIEASAFAREEFNKKGMDASQITGSASSYARKYALNGLFLIDDTKDADATNTHEKKAAKPAPAPKPTKFQINPEDRQKIADFLLDKGISPGKIQIRLDKIKSQAEVDEIILQIEKGAN
ncbi:MAG: ERF family protein [bacterium]|nr:ERF family protein [bacterium]